MRERKRCSSPRSTSPGGRFCAERGLRWRCRCWIRCSRRRRLWQSRARCRRHGLPVSSFPTAWRRDIGFPKVAARASRSVQPGEKLQVSMIMQPLEAFPGPHRDSERAVVQVGRAASRANRARTTGLPRPICAPTNLRKTTGADVYDGTTIDQIIAQKIGQETLLPSCSSRSKIPARIRATAAKAIAARTRIPSPGASPTQPLPMELDPQVAFERLFGSGGTMPRSAPRAGNRGAAFSIP